MIHPAHSSAHVVGEQTMPTPSEDDLTETLSECLQRPSGELQITH